MAYTYTQTSELTDVEEGTFLSPTAKCALEFALAAARTLRCKIGVPRGSEPGVHYYLYDDDCPITYARVGHAATQETNADNFYYVHSPAVNNERYADYNDNRYMTMTKSFDKALENVRRYVRRPNLLALADHYWKSVAMRNFSSETSEESQEVKSRSRKISTEDATLLELETLYRSGHEFTVATLADRVHEWITAKDEAALSARDRTSDVLFIHFKPDGSHQACKFPRDTWYTLGAEDVTVVEDLPEPVTQRVAALTICEDKSHVDLVGTRIASNCFVVYA
tara:strand:+ start:275 stop:1117 length:843 start_codon:yes stop_codon:yes gene_type:complete